MKSFEFLVCNSNDLQRLKEEYKIDNDEIEDVVGMPCIVYICNINNKYHLKMVNEEVISKYISALDDTWK